MNEFHNSDPHGLKGFRTLKKSTSSNVEMVIFVIFVNLGTMLIGSEGARLLAKSSGTGEI